jgi:hypothetical protein
MNTYWGRWDTQHYMEVIGQLHVPVALPPRKDPPGWVPKSVLKLLSREKSLTVAENRTRIRHWTITYRQHVHLFKFEFWFSGLVIKKNFGATVAKWDVLWRYSHVGKQENTKLIRTVSLQLQWPVLNASLVYNVTLKHILKNRILGIRTGLICLSKWMSGEQLWPLEWTFSFHKEWMICQLARLKPRIILK